MTVAPLITTGPIKQALVQKLRANSSIKSAAVGGIHEGLNASDRILYPYVVFSLAWAPYDFSWGDVALEMGFDIVVRGTDPVAVNSLDALITAELHDSSLTVTEPGTESDPDPVLLTTLILRRMAELPLSPVRNTEGKRVFQNGGTYEMSLAQATE